MKNCIRFTVVTAFVLTFAANASAIAITDSINLSDLLAGGSISSGGITFDDFSYVAIGDVPVADDILVTAITDTDGNSGLQFSGAFYDLGDGASLVMLGYEVALAGGSTTNIVGAQLMGNPLVAGDDDGIAVVTQSFLPDVADSHLEVHDFSTGSYLGLDSVEFSSGYDSLTVQQSIVLDGVGSSVATMSFFESTFKVANNPEPGSIGLLGLGLLGLLANRKRR